MATKHGLNSIQVHKQMGSQSPFSPAQLMSAAAAYSAAGSAPSWWGSSLQSRNTSGSAAPPPTGQTLEATRAATTAAAANTAWLRGLKIGSQPDQGSWQIGSNSQGQRVWYNTATGKTSFSAPTTAPTLGTPSIGDVSQYLQSLLNAGSGSSPPSNIQQAYEAAGEAEANYLANLRIIGSGSGSALGSGSGSAHGSAHGSAPGSGSGSGSGSAPGSAPGSGSGSSLNQGSGRSIRYFDGVPSPNTPTSKDVAKGIRRSDDLNEITYSSSINNDPRASGPITTLLDLTNRDIQEDDLFPLQSEITWFARDETRRLLPFAPVVQETALRGPAAFGQRFTFDLGSIMVGDLLLGTVLQIRLDHWLDPQTQNMYSAEKITYKDRDTAWEYANSLGTSIIQLAELEIDGKTIETIDGDFIYTFSSLFPDYNSQVGLAYDHLGFTPMSRLIDPTRKPSIFPIENGNLNCILPFFFMRTKLRAALPMIAVREGYIKIHITLRPFSECVRQMRRTRDTCTSVPPPITIPFEFSRCTWNYDSAVSSGAWDVAPKTTFIYYIDGVGYNWIFSSENQRGTWVLQPPKSFTIYSKYTWNHTTNSWSPQNPPYNINHENGTNWYYWKSDTGIWQDGAVPPNTTNPPSFTYGNDEWNSSVGDWSVAAPPFKSVQLLTYGAIVSGKYRSKMLHNPFEILHRAVQTFYFDEPLKYSVGSKEDMIRIQLPLEANHPIEEILWFVRRKGVSNNNEWTNFTGVLESEWNPRLAQKPMLQNAIIQANGTVICDADEQFYREGIASAHRGGYAAYSRFIYGYSFAKTPGENQPSGSMNASRLNSLRLILDVRPPGGSLDSTWEVKVFCIGMNWMRFENGLANPMFED